MLRLCVPALGLLLAAGTFAADRHKIDIDPESQDGILLQRIQQEPVPARKLAFLEKFVAQYPKATSLAWVYEQLLPIYIEATDWDKVLATAQSLLALDPDDLDAAADALQAAEAKKDLELIEKCAEASWDVASRAVQANQPPDPDDVPDWAKQVEYAKQVLAYAEYVLSSQASVESDRQRKAMLVQALEKRNPQSKYLAAAKRDGLHANEEIISPQRQLAMAEKGLPHDPDNEDFLMVIAEHNMAREKDLPKVLSQSLRVLEILQKKSKPDSVSAEDWEKKKVNYLGAANWMAGVILGRQGRYSLSDRHLRAALEYIRDTPQLLAAAYFYLGYDNYAMAGELRDKSRAIEAVKYSKLCAAIDGPFQPLAQRNLAAIRNEYNVE